MVIFYIYVKKTLLRNKSNKVLLHLKQFICFSENVIVSNILTKVEDFHDNFLLRDFSIIFKCNYFVFLEIEN